jgi:WD40 repeat protein
MQCIIGNPCQVNNIAPGNCSVTVAIAYADGAITLWDPEGGSHTLHAYHYPATAVAFSSDNKFLISGSKIGYVTLWSMESMTLWREFHISKHEITTAINSPADHKILGAASRDGLVIMDISNSTILANWTYKTMAGLNFSPNGQIMTCSWHGEIDFYEYCDLRVLEEKNESLNYITSETIEEEETDDEDWLHIGEGDDV